MSIKTAISVVKCLGPGWVAFRCWKNVSERFGYWERRIPSLGWEELSRRYGDSTHWGDGNQLNETIDSQGVKFLFGDNRLKDASKRLEEIDGENSTVGARLLEDNLQGKFPFFSGPYQNYGVTPDWFENPISKAKAPTDVHFSKINEFGYGDVKAIWELNRFGFVFDLARAYARTNDPRCGQRFWELFENWIDRNPPYNGVNWKCGQESGLRMIAIVFGYFAFRNHPDFTGSVAVKLNQFLAATGLRIERHISYAISQKNNHGISEAVALWTIGTLFPNLKRASVWQQKGADVLARLSQELIYEDGGFCQHSANYHRLLLHLMAWTIELANINQIELPSIIEQRFHVATEFLFQMMDSVSGRVPRYGNDDGALLFPLNNCEYQDYRPVINLCFAIINRTRQQTDSSDEDLFWFGLDQLPFADSDHVQSSLAVMDNAGCYVVRGEEDFAFVRAAKFVHRPCQLDMLHVDFWAGGNNIAIDPGTHSYNGEGIWKSVPFARGECHNSITIDGNEPARRVSKFLFVPWPESQLLVADEDFLVVHRHMSYATDSSVDHWRLVVRLPGRNWLVADHLDSSDDHDYRLHWLLGGTVVNCPDENNVSLQFKDGGQFYFAARCYNESKSSIVTAKEGSARGHFAPKYFELAAANSFTMTAKASSTQFMSFFGPDVDELNSLASRSSREKLYPLSRGKQDARSWAENLIQETARA